MKNVLASAGLVAIGALAAQNIHAQSGPGELFSGGDNKPWSVSGTLRGFYDDNYTTSPSGTNRLSSFGFEVKPSAALKFETPTTTLKASYFMDMRYYDDRVVNRADYSHDFELYWRQKWDERFITELSDTFVIAQEPELLNPNDVTSPLRADGNNLRNTAAVNMTAKANDELTFVLGYANTLFSYDQDYNSLTAAQKLAGSVSRSGALDRVDQSATLTGRYSIDRQSTAVLGYQFEDVGYTSEEILVKTGSANYKASIRDNHSHYAFTGLDHFFTPDLSASLRVGIQATEYYNDSASTGSFGPYVDLSSTWKYREDGALTLGFSHRRTQTDLIGNTTTQVTSLSNLSLDQDVSTFYLNFSQKITPKLTATLNGQFQSANLKGGLVGNDTEQFSTLGLNLTYEFSRFLRGDLGYNYDDLNSNVAVSPGQTRSYDRNRVYVGITASY